MTHNVLIEVMGRIIGNASSAEMDNGECGSWWFYDVTLLPEFRELFDLIESDFDVLEEVQINPWSGVIDIPPAHTIFQFTPEHLIKMKVA